MKQVIYKNKKVLVTGGCGFIGSELCKKLVSYGAQVTIIDNLSTGKYEAINAIKESIVLIIGDVTQYDLLQHYVNGQDLLIHLAAKTSIAQLQKNPLTSFNENIVGIQNILHAAYTHTIKRVFFASSAAVYGNQDGDCNESNLCNPLSSYGYSKLIGELLCKQYSDQYAIETICGRFFNVWSEVQQENLTHSSFIAKLNYNLAHNLPITLFGDGTQTRDFIHVSMLVDSILSLAIKPLPQRQLIINIATGKSQTLLELAKNKIEKTPSYTASIYFAPSKPGDIMHSQADCSLLKNIIEKNHI